MKNSRIHAHTKLGREYFDIVPNPFRDDRLIVALGMDLNERVL